MKGRREHVLDLHLGSEAFFVQLCHFFFSLVVMLHPRSDDVQLLTLNEAKLSN